MAKNYETMVIVDAMISEDAIAKALKNIEKKILTKGEMIRIDDWGKRKMSYEIEKKSHGHYAVFFYKGPAEIVDDLEKDFRINENILRWMTLADQPVTSTYVSNLPDDIGEEDYGADDEIDGVRIRRGGYAAAHTERSKISVGED